MIVFDMRLKVTKECLQYDSHRGEKDAHDLSCMTDVKKTDVWVRKILLMTSLQQLETTCQINSNSFLLQTSPRKWKFCLENTEEKDLPYHRQTNHFINREQNLQSRSFHFFHLQSSGYSGTC